MKKTHIIPIVAMTATLLLASACNFSSKARFDFQHPERYTIGNATFEQDIDKISIDWFSGDIDILYSDNPGVCICEKADTTLNDTLSMRHYVDEDGTLNIQFCKNGITLSSKKLKNLKKRLVIEVPRGINLDEIEIDGVNTNVTIDSVLSREMNVDGVNATFKAFYPTLPEEINIDAVNTTLNLHVPPTAGMTIELEGVNTEFRSELPTGKSGNKTILGDGKCEVNIDAVNGNLNIKTL